MSALNTMEDLFTDQLRDMYSAEKQLLKALPKMAKNAASPELREAFQTHLEETRNQVTRLDQIGENMGIRLTGKKCKGMEGLIEEGSEVLEAEGQEAITDLGLAAAAQKVEHYEISTYTSLEWLAERLGNEEAAGLIRENLEEERAAAEKLESLCDETLAEAAESSGESEMDTEEEEEEQVVTRGTSSGRRR